jgi:hypothetical protein
MKAWRMSAVQPLCDMLAESDTKHLAPQFGDGLTIEIEAPMVDDEDLEEKRFTNDISAGICTRNEMRARRGLPPLPGPEGDELVGGKQTAPGADGQSGDVGGGLNGPNKPVNQGVDDSQGGQSDGFPTTPFMRKSMRAAFDAVEEADKEWLSSRLKAFNPDEARDESGKWTSGSSSEVRHPRKPTSEQVEGIAGRGKIVAGDLIAPSNQFKLQLVPIEKIRTTEEITSPRKVEQLSEDYHTGQQIPPVVVDRFGKLREGHHRLAAAVDNGYTHVWALRQNIAKQSLGLSTSTGSDGGFSAQTCSHCSESKTFNARGKLLCQDCWKTNDLADTNGHTNGSASKGWITLKPYGDDEDGYVHVLIDGSGKILAGPKTMEGKNVAHLSDTHKQHGEESRTHPAPKTSETEAETSPTMTHHELALKVSDIIDRLDNFSGKVVTHKDGTVRVYLKENKGKRRGWEEVGEATIESDGTLTLDKNFEQAFFYDKPVLEEIRKLGSAQPQSRSVPERERKLDTEDPLDRMEQERRNGLRSESERNG